MFNYDQYDYNVNPSLLDLGLRIVDIVYSGMIHSGLERIIPDWNESFQTGMNPSRLENLYWCGVEKPI